MRILALLLTSALCASPVFSQDEAAVPKQPTASMQLQHAKSVKSRSRGTRGAARIEALDRAVEAYEAVRSYWPDSGEITAEAAFRRGEIHRTLGRDGQARSAFLEAVDAGKGTPFVARGMLEIGHLHRRAAQFSDALAQYQGVLDLDGAMLRYENDAREWKSRVHLDLEQWAEAEKAALDWVAHAEGPKGIVRATDLLARALVGAGQLDLAEQRITELREQLADLAGEPTKDGEALQRALDRMKAPEELREARGRAEEQNGQDAGSDPAAT